MSLEFGGTRGWARTSVFLAVALAALVSRGASQTAYFADGYHGGVYGHYPAGYTRFIVDTLQRNPRWKINLEIEPETWDWVRTNEPAAYLELKGLAADQSKNGRVEFVNPAYGQPYLWNISGESIIRHFVHGMRKTRQHFPEVAFDTYSSEEPCFTSCLPPILASLGFKYAVLKNPDTCWGGYTRAFGGEWVNWIGPDGTGMPTVPRYAVEALQPRSTWQTIAWNNQPAYLKAAREAGVNHPVGMCLQDAGWKNGPWLGNRTNTEYVTWRGYFENQLSGRPTESWRFTQEDVLVSLVWGSQVLQRLAQQVRAAENKLIVSEKIAALAALRGDAKWPATELDQAWRTLMLAQHHDCWIVPYNGRRGDTWADKVARWTESTETLCDDIIRQAHTTLSSTTDGPGDSFVRVFNTLGSPRSGIVSVALPANWPGATANVVDAKGGKVPSQMLERSGSKPAQLLFQAAVPALGYAVYKIQNTAPLLAADLGTVIQEDGACRIETDLYRIVLDPSKGGVITSLRAKTQDDREFVDAGSPRHFNEVRGFFHEEGVFHSSVDRPATIRVLENGPMRVRVEVTGKVGIHPFTQTISMGRGQQRIDVALRLDWIGNPGIGSAHGQKSRWRNEENQRAFYDDREKLVVYFPVEARDALIFKDAPFDVVESKLTDTFFTTWDGIKNNIVLNWFDVAASNGEHGMTVFTDHTTSYVHGPGHPPGLVLQYSGIGLWGRQYRITGPTTVRYAVLPHAGRWHNADVYQEIARWNEPLIAMMENSNSRPVETSLLTVDGTGFEVTSLTMEENDLFVRLFNAHGDETPQNVVFHVRASKVELVELNGNVQSRVATSTGDREQTLVKLAIPRFGIRTLRLADVAGVRPPGK